MKITRYPLSTHSVPVDFRADPDGEWEYESLVEAAGFSRDDSGVRVGALVRDFLGHAEGAAVVSSLQGVHMAGRYFAVIEMLAAPVQHVAVSSAVLPSVLAPSVLAPSVLAPSAVVPVSAFAPLFTPAMAAPAVAPAAAPAALTPAAFAPAAFVPELVHVWPFFGQSVAAEAALAGSSLGELEVSRPSRAA